MYPRKKFELRIGFLLELEEFFQETSYFIRLRGVFKLAKFRIPGFYRIMWNDDIAAVKNIPKMFTCTIVIFHRKVGPKKKRANEEQLKYLKQYMQENPDVANAVWTDVESYRNYEQKLEDLTRILNCLGPVQKTFDGWNTVRVYKFYSSCSSFSPSLSLI